MDADTLIKKAEMCRNLNEAICGDWEVGKKEGYILDNFLGEDWVSFEVRIQPVPGEAYADDVFIWEVWIEGDKLRTSHQERDSGVVFEDPISAASSARRFLIRLYERLGIIIQASGEEI